MTVLGIFTQKRKYRAGAAAAFLVLRRKPECCDSACLRCLDRGEGLGGRRAAARSARANTTYRGRDGTRCVLVD